MAYKIMIDAGHGGRDPVSYTHLDVYKRQVLMFLIHFICYLIIYLMTKDMKMLYFYGAQFVLFLTTLIIYGTIYKNASRLIVNNMCYLLMVGFVILTRLDFDMAVRQFGIAVAAACISLVIPAFMLRVRIVAVSYTHLDVYKRQEHTGVERFELMSAYRLLLFVIVFMFIL